MIDKTTTAPKSLHSFIISWGGKHDKAAMIATAVLKTSNAVTVIYSDPDDKHVPKFPCASIRRPNALFWEDKFRSTLFACKADILLIIHADCECDDWSRVPAACRRAHVDIPRTGVWSPLIDGTIHNINRTLIQNVPDSSYAVVTQTDGIVFSINRPIIDRMKKASLDKNVFGWGIDTMANCCSYVLGQLSIVDMKTPVHHPRGAGYERADAMKGMKQFLEQLTLQEEVIYHFMTTVQRLAAKVPVERPPPDPA